MKKDNKIMQNYSYYSNVLKKPFNTVEELAKAEEAYYADLREKENKAAQKKADAQKVENAFKALNLARKTYKEDLSTLTKEYTESLENLKKAFELGTTDIKGKLAAAEENYSKALKEFTSKYDQFHITLKDGDFETTVSSQPNGTIKANAPTDFSRLTDLFDLMFRF